MHDGLVMAQPGTCAGITQAVEEPRQKNLGVAPHPRLRFHSFISSINLIIFIPVLCGLISPFHPFHYFVD